MDRIPHWNQGSISRWADKTFGKSVSNLRTFERAMEEMEELRQALEKDDNNPHAVGEAADVVVILMRMVEDLGGNLLNTIDSKMNVNVTREWEPDGTGHGHHKKPTEKPKDGPNIVITVLLGIKEAVDEALETFNDGKCMRCPNPVSRPGLICEMCRGMGFGDG